MSKNHFRGKLKTDNGNLKKGDWVYGDLVNLIDGKESHHHIYGKGEVNADTVCQSTGETDKNRVEIFEGDIVKVDFEVEYVGIKPKPSYIGVVKFEKGAFEIYKKFNGAQFFFQCGLIKTVIGNIHDNPELLNEELNKEN